ncbi:MAG: VWD domain-containing protein [Thiotrichaceae bacterium]|nr:VWD domain-containing protein [Thiotrichaceae bacterium]
MMKQVNIKILSYIFLCVIFFRSAYADDDTFPPKHVEEYPIYDIGTGILHIPSIKLNDTNTIEVYSADLTYNVDDSTFEFIGAQEVETPTKVVESTFDPETGNVELPHVYYLDSATEQVSEINVYKTTLTYESDTSPAIFSQPILEQLPYFPSTTIVKVKNGKTLDIEWTAVTSSASPSEEIVYEIHLSDKPNFSPSDETLHGTVTGDISYTVNDLTPRTKYYVLVVAKDTEGNYSTERDYQQALTPTAPEFYSDPSPDEIINLHNAFVNKGELKNYSVAQYLKIYEKGEEVPLTISSGSIEGEHADDYLLETELPLDIAAGKSDEIKIKCTPTELGIRNATLNLQTNAPDYADISYPLECNGKQFYIPITVATSADDSTTPVVVTPPSQGLTELIHPQQGNSILITAENASQQWNRTTKFFGGISVSDNGLLANNKATHYEPFAIQSEIKPQAEHIGQNVDVLLVMAMDKPPAPYAEDRDSSYSLIDLTNEFFPLDWYLPASEQQPAEMYVPGEGWQPELLTAFRTNVTLEETVAIEFEQEQLTQPGMYYFHIAYRLENGDIIYSPQPVSLEVDAGEQPYFPGVVQIVSTNVDSASIAWLPASDNKTPSDQMIYEIHLSDTPNFDPLPQTLYTSVTGLNQVDLSGLTTATTYNLLVIALDQDGNRSKERDYRTLTTFSNPVELSTTTQFIEDKQLNLSGATTQDGVVFTYPTGGTEPTVGNVLFLNTADDVYMRKVDSVANTAQGLVVNTSDAILSDVIESGEIHSQLDLFDIKDAALNASSKTTRSSKSLRSNVDDNQYEVQWLDDFLVAKHHDYNEHSSSGSRATRKSSESASVEASVTFTPSLNTDFEWKGGLFRDFTVTKARIVATGSLKAQLGAYYNFAASGSLTKEYKIFKKTFTTRYLIGGVPVFQATTLSLNAELSASASSEIKAKAIANAIATLKLGVEWNPNTKNWENIMDADFTRSFTADISVHGKVVGSVRLIPNIKVRFYKVVTGNLSVEPFLTGTIAAESVSHADILESWGYSKTQLTRFDADLQAQAFVSASLDLFFRNFVVLGKTQIWESPKWVLFSLPTLKLSNASGEVNESISLNASTEDGTRNPFNDGSISWDVYPPNKASVSGSKKGTFTASEEGSYTIFFSGNSRIPGKLGRQFTSATVTVGPEEEDPEELTPPPPPENGEKADSNGDPHLRTFDHLNYSFQAAGEFTLVKSILPNDTFNVQVRQLPVEGSNDVSINQAAAMNVAGDRVGFYAGQNPPVSINGVPQDLPKGITTLPQGGSITKILSRYYVVWPNTEGYVTVFGSNALAVRVAISRTQRGNVVGLLGNADGDTNNDIAKQDGTVLGSNLSFEAMYSDFADSWRITQEESLFDYAEYETTASFTDKDFPHILAKSTDLTAEDRAAAEQICRSAGVTDLIILENCILDVALTGDSEFANIANESEIPQASATVAAPPAPTLDDYNFGQLKGTISDAVTGLPITGARVKLLSSIGTPVLGTTEKSTVNGVFETDIIPSGYRSNYQLSIEADGYIAEKVFGLNAPSGEVGNIDPIKLVPLSAQGLSNVTATITNPLTNEGIPELYVSAYRYIDSYEEVAAYATTDTSGNVILENLSAGNYTIRVSGEFAGDYVYRSIPAIVITGQDNNLGIAIAPNTENSAFQVILRWSQVPYDLDAHLTGPTYQGERFHVSFANHGADELWEEPYARLDYDDRYGVSAEVISIGEYRPSSEPYRFSVHDYKSAGLSASNVLSQTGATVEVYSSGTKVASFGVPNQEGTLWTVFEIDSSGTIIPVNTMGYEVTQGGVRSRRGIRSRGRNSELQSPVATDYLPIVFQPSKR